MNIELLKTFTILYVEDESALREDVSENILPFVKDVVTASNGAEGLELYVNNRSKFDLVITDILMPKMNGIDMIDEIRKIDAEVPVIYTTAFNDSEYMKKTIEQSVVSYIIKPIDIELLLKGIEKASLKIENERLKASLLTINQELEAKVDMKTKELRLKNEILYKQLHTDELTSLANRKSLREDILKATSPVLSIIDIDSFRTINDLYGEKVGNKILIDIAKLIKKFSKIIDCKAYRIGGDVFALLKDGITDIDVCVDSMKELIGTINHHKILIQNYGISINVDVTIGISKENIDIVEKANMALINAKNTKVPCLFYQDEYNLDKEYQNDMKWTKRIKEAIDEDRIVAYYQPIIDKEKNIVKYESLIRIIYEDKVYPPIDFLDIAKKVKLYANLTKIMIDTAFKKAKEKNCQVNINLSIQDIVNIEIVKMIEKKLEEYKIAHLVTFELLESESISDNEIVFSFINLIKTLGCKIAIDDLGSGYSNFSYLLKLKPDYIKIDGSLVKNIHKDENSLLITKTINDFAHNLGITTVAEFVHCEEVFKILKDIGIDEYQGYYFSQPLENI
jgi:diguanylate cyclase (GGDEF)-like protein